MQNRRTFLQQSGTFALGSLLIPNYKGESDFFNFKGVEKVGLQLYTLGNLMITDPKGTLEKLAAIGYREVESAGSAKGDYYGYTAKEFAALVKAAGLHWRSAHVAGSEFTLAQVLKMVKPKTAEDSARIEKMVKQGAGRPKTNLKNNYQQLANEAAEGGVGFLVCSSIAVDSLDEIKTAVEVFNRAGEACKKVGVQFAYHNHTSEFDDVEGHRPFDYILSNTDKNLVKMELDLAWATKAKQDPVELFKAHPGRFPLWHVKDLDKNTLAPNEAGAGIVDFSRIFKHAAESGMKYYFVEQDGAPQPLQNVTNSFDYLKKIRGKMLSSR